MERLTGRTALITGAASGIGETTAHRLGAEGAAVDATFITGSELYIDGGYMAR